MKILGLSLWLTSSMALAADPWPGDPSPSATLLTSLDVQMETDLSGSHWDPVAQRLWVTKPGRTWALQRNDAGIFSIKGTWPVGDEGITAASFGQRTDTSGRVLVLLESSAQVLDVNAVFGGAHQVVTSWSLPEIAAAISGKAGPEGIAFVPDGVLADAGFVDAAGQLRVSRRGMGGLTLIAHQNGGDLFAYDLGADAGFDFVGRYKTSETESSGLELDRSTGVLYVSHNTGGNFVELISLRSVPSGANGRRFVSLREYRAPDSTNLEGFALSPQVSGSTEFSCWYTEDHEAVESAQARARSLQWYPHCPLVGPDAGSASTDAGSTSTDAGSTSTDAGSTSTDAGSVSTDAGSSPTDAGSTSTDAGSSPTDAGSVSTDAGSSPPDAGSTSTDAGSSPTDAGSDLPDGGTLTPPVAGACGCHSADGGVFAMALLALWRGRRRT